MIVSMPTAGDISQLLGLIDLVKLAADADKSRAVLEQIKEARKQYDDAISISQEQQRMAAKAVQDAADRIDEADRADMMVVEAQRKAEELKADARAEREEAAQYVMAARQRAEQAAHAEQAAQAATQHAARVLEAANEQAAKIISEAQDISSRAQETLEQAMAKRAEYEGKLEQLRAVTGA